MWEDKKTIFEGVESMTQGIKCSLCGAEAQTLIEAGKTDKRKRVGFCVSCADNVAKFLINQIATWKKYNRGWYDDQIYGYN